MRMEYGNATRTTINTTSQEKQRLLIVDDSKVVRVTARKILSDHFNTVEALDGEQAWELLASEQPFSLVISDLSMPNLDGFGLLERIRNSHLPHISDLPVIIITGANESEKIKEQATLAGATDFIGKPFDAVHLLARTQAHASAHTKARTLREEALALEDNSTVDPLTRIANEMAFMERGYQQLAYAIRHNTKLSVFRIEIDNYDALYKAHGDIAIECIIQDVATVLTAAIRNEDTAARIGAARFALLLPSLNNNGIHNLANRIMGDINQRTLKYKNTRIHYTVSIGIAATEIRRDTRFDDLLTTANNRLVYAIVHGGDQAVYEGEEYLVQSDQPGTAEATASQEELSVEPQTTQANTPAQVKEPETSLPGIPGSPIARPGDDLPAIASRLTEISTITPVKASTRGSMDSVTTPPVPEQDTTAPLKVPDLSLATGIDAGDSRSGKHAGNETIVLSATSNPFAPLEQGSAAPDASTGLMSNKEPGNAESNKPAIQTVEIRTQRIGMLERLLTGLQSLFRKTRKPK